MQNTHHDATDWFEDLYAAAARGERDIPWDRGGEPHWTLVRWAEHLPPHIESQSAVVVGCGTGDDAAYVASLGFTTTAFDISPTAIAAAKARHATAPVTWQVADLLALPETLVGASDLVIENMTVQALPRTLRQDATSAVASLVAPRGTLVVLAVALATTADPADGPPWPLTRAEVDAFATDGLTIAAITRIAVPGSPNVHRWIAEFTKPGP